MGNASKKRDEKRREQRFGTSGCPPALSENRRACDLRAGISSAR